jgi:hypothetical protein
VLAVVSLLGLSAVVADAGTTKSVSYTLTGSSQWSALYFPSSFTAAGQLRDGAAKAGSYSGTLLAGTYTGACFNGPYGPQCAPATGTITLALRGGTVTATVDPGGLVTEAFTGSSQEVYIFDLTLSVTSGTHAYAGAQGTLSLHYQTTRDNHATDPVTLAPCYTIDIATCPIGDAGTLTGTISR